jgi:hypothetical protein
MLVLNGDQVWNQQPRESGLAIRVPQEQVLRTISANVPLQLERRFRVP